jgi:spermidine synthase
VSIRIVRHGKELELRIGSTCASWLRPGRILTGSIWDALALPALALGTAGRRPPRSALLLGVGGGSTARILRACFPHIHIVGVEASREVITVAERELGLRDLGIDVRIDDAYAYLRRTRRSFDLVIEDIFLEDRGGALVKPPWLPAPAFEIAAARLADGGIFVCNTIDESRAYAALLRAAFPYLVRIEATDCENHVFAASCRKIRARDLSRRLSRHDVMRDSRHALRCHQVR